MSRATLVDGSEVENNEETVTDSVDQAEDFESQEEVAQEETVQEEEALPEKYQGKSLKDLVDMHQNAEKLLGQQGSEVGELRKLVDDHIKAQPINNEATDNSQSDEDVDFFVDPASAVNRAIDNHPSILEAKEYTLKAKKETALSQLQSSHPDMKEVLSNSKFQEWIKASKIRTQLFIQADQAYDYDAANELLTLWKERALVAEQTVAVEKQARKQQLKSANTGSARGTGQTTKNKIYRRVDLIKLMREDPDRYASISDEVFEAYAEGRVR